MPHHTDVYYRLCPRCGRAVPSSSGERYCINDGSALLAACSACGARITSPYSRFCGACGRVFGTPQPEPLGC
ncbi:zinc ribbon domain-containing protein [Deinococcus sp.]|uniref:zinc ribbon domain-containing protein n=1 Tax=Deinococcus sp. TaxID=47478 RepID=UPI00286DA453|nr:zinc ribbon domain-containing protein [Deinococcus sp.]